MARFLLLIPVSFDLWATFCKWIIRCFKVLKWFVPILSRTSLKHGMASLVSEFNVAMVAPFFSVILLSKCKFFWNFKIYLISLCLALWLLTAALCAGLRSERSIFSAWPLGFGLVLELQEKLTFKDDQYFILKTLISFDFNFLHVKSETILSWKIVLVLFYQRYFILMLL